MAQRDSIFAPDRGPAQPEKRPLTGALLWTMTVASAAAVANIYYNQPLLAEMMRAFHASPHAIGLVATFTQVGYALGLPVFVPFGDFVERRRLVVLLFLAEGCSLIAAALAQNLIWFIVASLSVGFTSIIPQIMIPLAAELTTPEEQGRTIGRILSGILLGILLARTVSGVLGGYLGWRVIYWAAAVMALVFACLLRVQLPPVPGHVGEGYRGHKILSLNVLDELVLRVESTWWPGQAVAFKFKFPADLGPLLRLPDYGRPDFGQSTVIWMPHSRRRETVVGLKVQVEGRRVSVLAAGV
jgi:predicted MFS family arabinose efflux permease